MHNLTAYEEGNPSWKMYPGISERKSFCEKRGHWVRKTDCRIAEEIMGYKWLACSRKLDFAGLPFGSILTHGVLDASYILEPDTRVPNFSTCLLDALTAARAIGLGQIPVLKTDKEMAGWICNVALKEPD